SRSSSGCSSWGRSPLPCSTSSCWRHCTASSPTDLRVMPVPVAFPSVTPHPAVWLLVGLFAAGYAIGIVRLAPRWAPAGLAVVTRFQITCWSLGVFAMWVASDYPVHDIAERYNFSVHMVQHLLFTMVVAPLLLLGMPAWLLRRVLAPRWLFGTVRTLSRFIPALLIFN